MVYTTFICFFLAVVVSLCSEWAGGTSAKKKLEVPRSVGRYEAMMEKVSGKVSRKCIVSQPRKLKTGMVVTVREWKVKHPSKKISEKPLTRNFSDIYSNQGHSVSRTL